MTEEEKRTGRRERHQTNAYDSSMKLHENMSAAMITPAPTLEQIQDASELRAKEYAETDNWLSKYKWDEGKIRKALDTRVARNRAFFEETKGKVWSMGQLVDENPEYIERFESHKKLKEKIQTYSGDDLYAAEEALKIKKYAEERGEDYSKAARAAVYTMEGHNHADSRHKEVKIAPIKQRKKSLITRALDWLAPGPNETAEPMSVIEMMNFGKEKK